MSEIARAMLDRYNSLIDEIGTAASSKLAEALTRLFSEYPDLAPEEYRELCVSILWKITTEYGTSASEAAKALRYASAETAGLDVEALYPVEYVWKPDPKRVEGRVRRRIGTLLESGQEEFIKGMTLDAYSISRRAALETTVNISGDDYRRYMREKRRDKRYRGNGPRFARVPGFSEAYGDGCPFCKMLASRGFVYASRKSAGEQMHYHDHCTCTVIEGFGARGRVAVEGYDPADYDEGFRDWASRDHSKSKANQAEKRRNRYTHGKLRAGYSGLRVDQQETYTAEARAKVRQEARIRAAETRRGHKNQQ